MTFVYAVISAAALALAGICCVIDKSKDVWLRLFFVAVFICDLGYFLVSVSQTLSEAIAVHRVVFFGSVFMPLLLMMKIMHMCGTKYPQKLPSALVLLGMVMFVGAFVPGTFGLYYTNMTIERVNGVTRLVREFSPMFIVYVLYYVIYSLAMLIAIFRAVRAKRLADPNHAGFLASAVLLNVVVWIVEKLVPSGFEILTVTYLMSELFILFMHMTLQRYGLLDREPVVDDVPEVPAPEEREPVREGHDGGMLFSPEWIERVVSTREELSCLSEREKEVLKHILANEKRKEIAEELVVTESTIKKHTSQIYKKLGVTNRIDLFVKMKSLE